jgi:hypothetical protein
MADTRPGPALFQSLRRSHPKSAQVGKVRARLHQARALVDSGLGDGGKPGGQSVETALFPPLTTIHKLPSRMHPSLVARLLSTISLVTQCPDILVATM